MGRLPLGPAQRQVAGRHPVLGLLHFVRDAQVLEGVIVFAQASERQAQAAQHDKRGRAVAHYLGKEIGCLNIAAQFVESLGQGEVALLRENGKVGPPDGTNEGIGRGQFSYVGSPLGEPLHPHLAGLLRRHAQSLWTKSALQGANCKLRVAARRNDRRPELQGHDRAIAVEAIGLGQIFQGVLGEPLPQQHGAKVERRVDMRRRYGGDGDRLGELPQAIIHHQRPRLPRARRLERLQGALRIHAAEEAQSLPKRRLPAGGLHKQNAGQQLVHRLVIGQRRQREETAHLLEHGGLDEDLGSNLGLAKKLGRPQQKAQGLLELLVRQGNLRGGASTPPRLH